MLSCICQDALTSGELATKGIERIIIVDGKSVKKWYPYVPIDVDDFNDSLTTITQWDGDKDQNRILERILKKLDHIKEVFEWQKISLDPTYCEYCKSLDNKSCIHNGHLLFSVLLPNDFEYEHEGTGVKIIRGVMVSGMLSKASLGISPSSMTHKLEKEYGAEATIDFISNFQFIMNHYIRNRGFSIGIQDFLTTKTDEIKENILKCFSVAQSIEDTEKDPEIKEQKINFALNDATTIGKKISKESTNFDNSLIDMIKAGSKGSTVNVSQIMANVGQQNVEGKRIPANCEGRTSCHYPKKFPSIEGKTSSQVRKIIIKKYESGGFVSNSYIHGLNPQECFFHAEGGREGIIDTGIKTATSGYIQRKLVKKMEDFTKAYNGLVVDSKGNVIQFNTRRDFDPARLVTLEDDSSSFVNIYNIVEKLNTDVDFERYLRNKND